MKIMSIWVFLILLFSFFIQPLTNDNILSSCDAGFIEKFAIIIGISDYEGDEYDLNCPARSANDFYNELLANDGWVKNNIYLLINESAKKSNILDALDSLQTKTDKNDIVIFFFAGHGTTRPDDNGDEDFDHAIISYDLENILDDKLDIELSEIESKGMYIIIDSCFSGGFNELGGMKTNDIETYDDAADYINCVFEQCREFRDDFSEPLASIDNRVIFTSSLPYAMTIEIDTPLHGWIDVSSGLPKSIQSGEKTAEDISKFVKNWWLSIPSISSYIVLMLLFHLVPPFDIIEALVYLISGGILTPIPIPLIIDSYDGKLTIIGNEPVSYGDNIESDESMAIDIYDIILKAFHK
jgi:hypothetical protein